MDANSNEKPLLEVAILTYNRRDFLKGMLDSLCAQTLQNFRITVFDNASTDGTGDFVRAFIAEHPQRDITYSRSEKNLGQAARKPAIVHFVDKYKPWEPGYNTLNPYYHMYFEAQRYTAWRKNKGELEAFYRDCEGMMGRVFRHILFKTLLRKPWHPLRRYFWQRALL